MISERGEISISMNSESPSWYCNSHHSSSVKPSVGSRVAQCAHQFQFEIKSEKIIFSLLFVWQFLKFIQEHDKNNFLNFQPLTWHTMTSSNLGPFFRNETLINWKCSNVFKNQYLEIWTQSVFLCLRHVENKKMTVSTKVPQFPDFSNFPKNSDFGPLLSQNSRSKYIWCLQT